MSDHGHDTPQSFVSKYIFSLDHKVIGIQFLLMSMTFALLGGFLAMLIRWQVAFPTDAVPVIGGLLPESWAYDGHIVPQFYNVLFTMHGSIMIFFVIIPVLTGAFGNFLIPLMIGAPDMAFPKLNMLSFWVTFVAGVVMLASFFVPGGSAAGGWTAYPPLTSDAVYLGVDWGQTLWIISLVILGTGSIMGSINYLTTIINMRAPGMSFFRMPLAVWSMFITAMLVLFATPVLTSALGMLLFDRLYGTSFFLPEGGGQPLLWQHLFWFYSHPAVYIMILPAMGMVSDVLATFSRKPIFGYKAMAYSMLGIACLGFIVWGHHMFQSGMNPVLGSTFAASTILIAVPSSVKTFNWLGTLWRGSIRLTAAMLNAISFVAMFVIGGLSGVFMATSAVDIYIHDTYFIVAHIHYVLFGGSLFGAFAAVTYWYPKMFGRMMSERLGKIHFWLTFITFNGTFFPMHLVGVGGMMRRIHDPYQYEFLSHWQGWNQFMTINAFILGAAQFLFLANVLLSLRNGEKAGDNPWNATTLEWATTSPAPHGNFPVTPTVYRGPYEYSHPEASEDYWPQHVSGVTAGAS